MKELTKYHNDLNRINTRNWTAEEMNLFFTIATKMKDKGSELITLDSDDLKPFTSYVKRSNKILFEMLDSASDKIMDLKYKEYGENGFKKMNLFQRFDAVFTDEDECTVTVRTSEDFAYILNQVTRDFTVYDLAEFTSIKGTYAKTLFRLLKQYRQTGQRDFKLDEYRYLMGFSEGYPNKEVSRITKKAISEISHFFPRLTIQPLRKGIKGRPLTGYRFTWKPEQANKWMPDDQYKAKVKKEQARKRASKPNLPDWYNDIPEEKATKEEIEAVLKLQKEILGK